MVGSYQLLVMAVVVACDIQLFMKIKLLLFFGILLLVCSNLSAQQVAIKSQCEITGQVFDNITHKPEPYATIKITNEKKEKNSIKMGVTDKDGKFSLMIPIVSGNYIMTMTSLGKQSFAKHFVIAADEKLKQLGKLYMEDDAKQIGEIEVTAQKPLVKMDVDKLSYDVASDPDAKILTVMEMMRKVPLISVNGNDNIELNGTTNFLVLQNGRKTAITRNPKIILQSLPSTMIKSIEVITSPGAKYDAEGIGGIINIVTIGPRFEGHLTSVGVGASYPTQKGYNAGIFTTTRIGKVSLDGNLNYSYISSPNIKTNTLRENLNSDSQTYLESNSSSKSKPQLGGASINASYEIDTLRLLTFSLSGIANQGRFPSFMQTEMWNRNRTSFAYSYHNSSTTKNSVIAGIIGLDYQRLSHTNKQRMSTLSYLVNLNPSWNKGTTIYEEITNNTATDIVESLLLYDNRIDTYNKSIEHTFQYDFTTPIGKSQIFETGMKYIYRNNESNNKVFDAKTMTEDYILNDKRSNHYRNRNDILSAYLSYTYRGKMFSLMPGLRYEYTYQNIKYLAGAIGSEGNYSANYSNLVPSIKLNFKLSEYQSLRLEYNMRISRPSIYYLNPYFNDINPQYITQGNSNLDTERSQTIAADYGLFANKFNVNLSLNHTFLHNGIESVSRLIGEKGEYFDNGKHFASPGAMYTTYMNVGQSRKTTFSVYASWSITKRLRWTNNGDVSYLHVADKERQLCNHGWTGYISSSISWNMPADIRLYVGINASSSDITLQGRNTGVWGHNFNISRSFLKRKLNVSFGANDPFKKWTFRNISMSGENFHNMRHEKFSRQTFSLTIRYTFGNLRQSTTKRAQHSISNDDVKR